MSTTRRHLLKRVAAMASAVALPQVHAANQPLRLAIVPQFTAVEIYKSWAPLATLLEQRCKIRIELAVANSIAAFEQEFLKGNADLVYLNPYHMVMANNNHGYVPLVRDSSRLLSGILVVRAQDGVSSIAALAGQQISFPAPNAFGASLYMRALLARKHGVNINPHYAMTHRNAYRMVLSGASAAAGGVKATFQKEDPDVREALKVIFETPGVPAHPLAAHPRVNKELRTVMTQTMIELGRDPDKKMLMDGIQMSSPMAANYLADYAPLQELKLEKFVVLE
ncbi:MAG: phosphate/phosphite/phosphonate ABC transporter substrate-binding protein [Gammaproteobacteria bacterium]|nr:phosphate/phosphite/phosphonate ABC transporter substrate-binding protein [Gammaproteobacteria bacterium]MBU0787764.1 phosphate/phosphite/phosphonate ABC transporter substrate-binding protein [Gammaproteobacteria bacterium]MBU0816213.1 phosphate/phosphite/phosphonate ABC transporter substrate-binding protein [Gammaproteobacteria bacterium]MBU1786126.1 phosphate/phosphite/phosphonate ABC transporter substrate-binding protein [Gammaproteobacteria bacterium]